MPKRILVADDSVTIQKAFAMVLGGQDVTLVPARSPDEALSAARQQRPDLVIADAAFGSGTGYDLCSSVKADPALRGVPVLILASAHVPYDEVRGQRVGADGHLLKPFDSTQLIERLSEVLSAGASRGAGASFSTAAPSFSPPSLAQAPARSAGPPPPDRVAPPPQDDDDSYGEFTIERTGPGVATPGSSRPPGPAAAAAMRPSMIPGAAPAGARPGGATTIPGGYGGPGSSAPAPRPPAVPPPLHTPAPAPAAASAGPVPSTPRVTTNRTIMGFPAVIPPSGGGQPRPVQNPGMPAQRPVAPPPAPPPAAPAAAPAAPAAAPSPAAGAVSAAVDRKMAELSARGPEYAAIAKLSREVIEQVVWEVVPELAEAIIRENVERLRR